LFGLLQQSLSRPHFAGPFNCDIHTIVPNSIASSILTITVNLVFLNYIPNDD